MDPLLLLSVAVVIALVLFAVHKVRGSAPSPPPAGNDTVNEGDDGPAVVAGVGRRARARRIARRVAEDEDDLDTDQQVAGGNRVGTKKLKKLQAKADKKAMREQEEALRKDEKQRKELREKERKEKEVENIARQKKQEDQILKLKAEQEEREHQEYLKLKERFIVEEEGVCEESDEQKTLNEFIAFIKSNKVVFLEDLAAEFNMRTQSVIDRIQTLQQAGQLTGVVDDRGKFIYVSLEELRSVAKFIKQRGRVSISELAQSSNSLVTLQ